MRGRGTTIGGPGRNSAEARAFQGIEAAAARVGYDHPVVRECLQALLDIARGKCGGGRAITARYRAITQLLDRLAGKPRESAPAGTDHSDVDRYLSDLVDDTDADG